jgi:hypothetical protein
VPNPGEQPFQAFAAARGMAGEIGAPGVQLGQGDVTPEAAVPMAKVHFRQVRLHPAQPALSAQQFADLARAGKGADMDFPGQPVAAGKACYAPGQAAQPARVHGGVGTAQAASLYALWPGVAPDIKAHSGHWAASPA